MSSNASAYKQAARVAVIVTACIVLLLLTRPTSFGDTYFYVNDISSYLHGQRSFVSLLEFGHLLWRPAGALLGMATGATTPAALAALLVDVNLAATLACALFLYVMALSATGGRWIAAGTAAITFCATAAVLSLSRAGTAWLPGLACILCACWVSTKAEEHSSVLWWAFAALLTALACLLWIPYVLSSVTIVCACLLRNTGETFHRRIVRAAIGILPAAAIIVLAAYVATVLARGFTRLPDLLLWMQAAEHGEARRSLALLRLTFGLPRSFLILGETGILWKQYLLRDPYAHVSLLQVLAGGGLPVLSGFYAATALLVFALWRLRSGVLVWLIVATLPTLGLALAFEAGSMERYLAIYPPAFVGVAVVLSHDKLPPWIRVTTGVCLCLMIVNNVYCNFYERIDTLRKQSMARLGLTIGKPTDVVLVLDIRDPLNGLFYDPASYAENLPQVDVIKPPAATMMPEWRRITASAILHSWQRTGAVWVTARALAAQPVPRWLWVEGDGDGITWSGLRSFFTALELDRDNPTGGSDGFWRIRDSSINRKILAQYLAE